MKGPARSFSRFLGVAAVLPATVLAVSASGLGVGGAGCSSSSSPASALPYAEAVCPDTVPAAIGAACAVEGLVCSPEYPCGVATAIARCTCTAGAFACIDVADAALTSPDATPTCPEPADAQACPKSEQVASLFPCTETGLVCTYPSSCEDATPAFDQCQCVFGALPNGSSGLRFQCSTACTYTGTPVDLGDDAGSDANDATPADAGGPETLGASDAVAPDAPDALD